jgi:two-component system cell cycle response regulator
VPLRVRLSLAFVAVVVAPLAVTALLIQLLLSRSVDENAYNRVGQGEAAVTTMLDQLTTRAGAAAFYLASNAGVQTAVQARDPARARALVQRQFKTAADEGLAPDFVAVIGADRRVTTATSRTPQFLAGVEAPRLADLATADSSPYALLGRADLARGDDELGTVVAGFWLDNVTLRQALGRPNDVNATAVADGHATASTFADAGLATAVARSSRRDQTVEVDGLATSRVMHSASVDLALAAKMEPPGRGFISPWVALAAIVAGSALLAGLLGWLLARLTTKPLEELSDAAMNIASGRFDTRIVVPASGEVGRLAIAFNAMSDELTSYVQALEGSRDDLKRNLTRLGETLSSTHDLNKMLAVILETAMATLRADAGALMLFSANRDDLYIKVGRGLQGRLDEPTTRVRLGEGVAGTVGRTGEPLHGAIGNRAGDVQLSPAEPRARAVIAVPLKGQGRIQGVLNLYDKEAARQFDDEDLATLRTFATQATVAIDNVLLHHEAQRLSITDGLTGLWNYRYFQMTFEKEIERAIRFGRPMSLLILDLDKFKDVNDAHGHQRGDSVLIELATRIKGAIREVDTLARYGGEEFVLILPETDLAGAEQAAEKVNELVRQLAFSAGDEPPLRLTISIGIAVYPDHGDTPAALIKAADTALYAAKAGGRDRHEVAVAASAGDVPSRGREMSALNAETRNALESAAAAVAGSAARDTDEGPAGT